MPCQISMLLYSFTSNNFFSFQFLQPSPLEKMYKDRYSKYNIHKPCDRNSRNQNMDLRCNKSQLHAHLGSRIYIKRTQKI